MKYEVLIKKDAAKNLQKLSKTAKKRFSLLIDDLKEYGPIQPSYPNYSKLGKITYHCHLDYHWVVCWRCEDGQLLVEVYYVGSRESAPY